MKEHILLGKKTSNNMLYVGNKIRHWVIGGRKGQKKHVS
jgi:hypothetical protein